MWSAYVCMNEAERHGAQSVTTVSYAVLSRAMLDGLPPCHTSARWPPSLPYLVTSLLTPTQSECQSLNASSKLPDTSTANPTTHYQKQTVTLAKGWGFDDTLGSLFGSWRPNWPFVSTYWGYCQIAMSLYYTFNSKQHVAGTLVPKIIENHR